MAMNNNMNMYSMSLIDKLVNLAQKIVEKLCLLSPIVDLVVRLWVANVFITSGLTKISNWDLTLSLFESEYHVAFLPPAFAAYLGTAAELGLPILLLVGFCSRFAAIALFIFNIVAVVSYPDLSELGLKDHQVWGLLMLVTVVHGPGKLSIDHFLKKYFFKNGIK
ncbi:MAG: DoxX family protein [Methylophilaceae bacterium]